MDDVEFLWSCVKEGKLSKEAALDLLEKRAEIFSSEGDDGTRAGAHGHSSASSKAEKEKATFFSVGSKRYPVNESNKKAELIQRYKSMQKEGHLKKGKEKIVSKQLHRKPLLIKIGMGGMKFDVDKQRGAKCKELGPITCCSVMPSTTYEDLVERGIKEFFDDNMASGHARYDYFLADSLGSKLPNDIDGNPWTLAEYLHAHGLYPSKTKLYCVQCPKESSKSKKALDDQDQISNEQKSIIQEVAEEQMADVIDLTQQQSSDQDNHNAVSTTSQKTQGVQKTLEHLKIPLNAIKLRNKLGEGGYGTVYLSEINGTFIAVKKVNVSNVTEQDMNEISALSLLHHPNIVVFMGYAIEDHHAYICTNYVHGGDLFKLLFKDKTALTVNDRISIADQAAQAINYMHNLSPPMIHRDIKPMNILVEKSTLHVYLTDMGLAKLKTSNSTITKMDPTGTPYYSAPETYHGGVGIPSDIWSFGIVMIELFGSKRAWGELKHHNELIANVMSKKIPSMVHLNPPVKKVCECCLVYEPKGRKPMIDILSLLRNIPC